ncbi:vesicle-associated protein 4-1-like [Impatiens glandulifera]|uniref:vesicle-associated protein 4-1-like n=1 Tax=Impatiens glandulifera TaxID=253017 RepID=UPI001FB10CD2|nr:vesicle-associated protein 4-1-like [Impatiens glandulifera]
MSVAAVAADPRKSHSERVRKKMWRFCPLWQSPSSSSSDAAAAAAAHNIHTSTSSHTRIENAALPSSNSLLSLARPFLPSRRRLRLDPATNLYFPYEPGKQVRSAVRIKNTSSKSHVAFKFQTTAPKSSYMRPPGGILAPRESIIATVFKYVEHPENNEKPLTQKSKAKFKIMSLKVKQGIEYIPELFEEQKDDVTVERILRVVFMDVERPGPAMEKLKRQLAEAEAAVEAHKKPPHLVDTNPPPPVRGGGGDGLIIDEWKERREKYLARQQVEGVDSV